MTRPLVRIACLALAALALGAVTSEASARGYGHGHGHGRVGVYIGAPIIAAPYYYGGYYRPWSYGYPSYYPPTTVVTVPAAPTTYIEQAPVAGAMQAPVGQAPAQTATLPAGYWYFCAGSNAYYPYVKDCPSGWQQVAPQPSAAPAAN